MRRVRLDEEDLVVMLGPALAEQGYIPEGHEILGFEYKTKRIRKGGDYYRDGVKDGEYPPEGVDEVRWIKVLVGPAKRRQREEEPDVEADEVAGS
jgi:hypothetical protein